VAKLGVSVAPPRFGDTDAKPLAQEVSLESTLLDALPPPPTPEKKVALVLGEIVSRRAVPVGLPTGDGEGEAVAANAGGEGEEVGVPAATPDGVPLALAAAGDPVGGPGEGVEIGAVGEAVPIK